MALKWFKKKGSTQATANDKNASEEAAEKRSDGGADPQQEDHGAATPSDTEAAEQAVAQIDAPQDLPPAPPDAPPRKKKPGLFSRLKKGLSKTREILTTDIDELFSGKNKVDDDMLEELEELLITSDIGVQTAMDLMKTITKQASRIGSPQELKEALKQEVLALLRDLAPQPPRDVQKPRVIMVVGVNGVGKTTTIGKLAAKAVAGGQRVLIAAADTFRAAAIEQLAIWADRAGADLVKHKANADPAAVAYDGMEAALARGIDTVFVDTAGRLHTKVNLMEELKKISRTIAKKIPGAPHEILLVIDATTGQNALSQAKLFNEAMGLTGLALTKLDGTAKGGIVISICQCLNIPLQYIGVGEGIDDLQEFEPDQFANALF